MPAITPAFDLGSTPVAPPPNDTQRNQLLESFGLGGYMLPFIKNNSENDTDDTQRAAARALLGILPSLYKVGSDSITESAGASGVWIDKPGTYVIATSLPDAFTETTIIRLAYGVVGMVTIINETAFTQHIHQADGGGALFLLAPFSAIQLFYANDVWRSTDSTWNLGGGNSVSVSRESDTQVELSMRGSDNVDRTSSITFSGEGDSSGYGVVNLSSCTGYLYVTSTTGYLSVNAMATEASSTGLYFEGGTYEVYSADNYGSVTPGGNLTGMHFGSVTGDTITIADVTIPYGAGGSDAIHVAYSSLTTLAFSNGHCYTLSFEASTVGNLTFNNWGIGGTLEISNMNLSGEQLNAIFSGLAVPPSSSPVPNPSINVFYNPGEVDCDYSIAVAKGYHVYGNYFSGAAPL